MAEPTEVSTFTDEQLRSWDLLPVDAAPEWVRTLRDLARALLEARDTLTLQNDKLLEQAATIERLGANLAGYQADWDRTVAALQAAREIIGKIHEALGEDRASDDDSLPGVIAEMRSALLRNQQ